MTKRVIATILPHEAQTPADSNT
ncbi:MAG: hypothetical protein QOD43_5, partial [Gaiellaceae bacterium]|nr:hypothetical protein [Gaiellaceae bacterium]